MARRSDIVIGRWIVAIAVLCAGAALLVISFDRDTTSATGPTVGEKLDTMRSERANLQARADGEARIELLQPYRIASLLTDALAARREADRERYFARMPSTERQAFADLQALNMALKEALAHPGAGAQQLAQTAGRKAQLSLEHLAGADGLPLVLLFTPRFVPPRRATGELTLAPRAATAPPIDEAVSLDSNGRDDAEPAVPTVPRYAPSFAASSEDDPPVVIEIVGQHLAPSGEPLPVLTIGTWRGEPTVAPERLRFAVPRNAFTTEVSRTVFVAGMLAIPRTGRATIFELLFTVLPDRPGSIALDQKVRRFVSESETLVSPEILARGQPGESRTVHRCFDSPPGSHFDKARRRVIVVERLGSLNDISDPTLNDGTVDFAPDGGPDQICVNVTAKPVNHMAKTATIGRFEATLVRERTEERVVHSGVRALDWREPVRVPFEKGDVAWRLYVRIFDEIDREFVSGDVTGGVPFVQIEPDVDNKAMVFNADPNAAP